MLNDAELNAFQVRCFNAPLQPEELMGVKKVVQDKMPQVQTSHCRLRSTRSVCAPDGWQSMVFCNHCTECVAALPALGGSGWEL